MCRLIEEKAGFAVKSPTDFTRLAEMICEKTGSYISESTLKRLFGYIEGWQNPRPGVWNILSRFVGFVNEAAFRTACGLNPEAISGEVMKDVIHCAELEPDAEIELRWYPNRYMLVRYAGGGDFRIIKAMGTHLKPGGTFHAETLAAHDALLLNPYTPPTEDGDTDRPLLYEIGRTGGIEYSIVQSE